MKAAKTNESKKLIQNINFWIETYLPLTRGKSPNTIEAYKIAILLYFEYLDTLKGGNGSFITNEDFSREKVEGWINYLRTVRKNSALTCDQRLAIIKSLVRFLRTKDHLLDSSYLDICEIKSISHGFGKKVESLSEKAMTAFMEAIDCSTKIGLRDFAMFTFMLDTGCRAGEILSIRIKDLKLNVKEPSVTILGKGKKYRTLYLSEKDVDSLQHYISIFHGRCPNINSYLFFSSHKGFTGQLDTDSVNERISLIAEKAHRKCEEVPLNMHSHQIRHTAATNWFKAGVSIVKISLYLGHESVETTRRYIGITQEDLKEILNRESKKSEMAEEPIKKYKNLKGGLRDLINF